MGFLAQYSIRAKQDYIFKTNKILEITGASVHISDAWKYLFACADSLEMKYETSMSESFNKSEIEKKFQSGDVQFVELFCGGGNETILFSSKDNFIKLNREFSLYLLKKCPGMIPMAVGVESSDNYKEDYAKLMEACEVEKNKMTSGQENFILPFSMMDRNTLSPMTRMAKLNKEPKRYSEESYSKYTKGIEEREEDKAIKYLDSLVSEKGKESLLAVVHADGNNMGSKIMDMLHDETTYDRCVSMMREFTNTTAKAFGEVGLAALCERREELAKKDIDSKKIAYRVIINDGDDMTFICNARYVLEYTEAYIKAVQNFESKWSYSSCAGICIFHSHYPFSKAYEIAEQACDDGAKQKVHVVDENGITQSIEEGWLDFHYIHSGVGGKLDTIRETQNTVGCMARPWNVIGNNTDFSLVNLRRLDAIFKEKGVARASIKQIGTSVETSVEIGRRELGRLYNHKTGLRDEVCRIFNDEEKQLKAIYDYAEVYDLWFAEGK